ncbi:MFS transporter [Leucobacter salsicius]|uniref:MFS transporter n=1 Tax=Leucobacter salsicius TaxID=664638 RepID=UPI00034CA64E|nr:MFS transporter [Leucobacter salsicius]
MIRTSRDSRAAFQPSPGLIVAVLAAAGILVSLAQTLIVPLIGELPSMFDTSAANASWIITSTLLAGAVSTPITGRLADLYGKKLMLLVAIAAFVAGSIACALADSLGVMVLGRTLQGVASGMVPLGISILHELLPREKAGAAIALMSSSMGIGGALGLPIAAGVAQFADWRMLFWGVGIAALIVGTAIAVVIRPRPQGRTGASFDVVGAIGLAIGLVALLLGISKGSEWGWASPLTLGSFGIAIAVLGLWGWYELRLRHPLISLRTAIIPTVLYTNLASIMFGFVMYAMNLVVPQVMQLPVTLGYGLGQPMVIMGLWMMPIGIGMMAVAKMGAEISRTRGPRVTLMLAGIVIAVGYGVIALVLGTLGNRAPGEAPASLILTTIVLLTIGSAVSGCGIGFAFGAMPALVMGSVPAAEVAAANGFNALMRSLGTTSAAAIVGVILASMMHDVGGTLVPTLDGFLVSLAVAVGAALAGTALAAAIPRGRK